MNKNEWPLSLTEAEYPLSISIIDEDIRETGLKIKIAFSHFRTEAVYFFISIETPAGTLFIDPKTHYAYGVIYDMDNFIDSISRWLKGDSEEIYIKSYEEFFRMDIIRSQYNKEKLLITMSIDAAKILVDTIRDGYFGISLVVKNECIEELLAFFREISRLHELYRIESPERFF